MNQPIGGTATKAKPQKTADFTSAFEAFSFPTGEIPAAFREAAEKSVSQARDAYAKMKTVAEEATDLLEEDGWRPRRSTIWTLRPRSHSGTSSRSKTR